MKTDFHTLSTLHTAVIVTGEGADGIFKDGGLEGLFDACLQSPHLFHVSVMDFTGEEALRNWIRSRRESLQREAPLERMVVLEGKAAVEFELMMARAARFDERFFVNGTGAVSVRRRRPAVRLRTSDIPDTSGAGLLYHDPTDMLSRIEGAEHLYIHGLKDSERQYVLDFKGMRYWRLGCFPPEADAALPPYSSVNTVSDGARSVLMSLEGACADVLLNCRMRWTFHPLVLEISRRQIVWGKQQKVMYNFFLPSGKYLSPVWFDGVDTEGRSKVLDNLAYMKLPNGKQWFKVSYSGRVGKDKFEPQGF